MELIITQPALKEISRESFKLKWKDASDQQDST